MYCVLKLFSASKFIFASKNTYELVFFAATVSRKVSSEFKKPFVAYVTVWLGGVVGDL